MNKVLLFFFSVLSFVLQSQPSWQWAESINPGFDPNYSQFPMAEDSQGNIYVSVNSWDVSGSGKVDSLIIVKLNSSGAEIWRKYIPSDIQITDLQCSGNNLFFTANFKDSLIIDKVILVSNGDRDGCLASLDMNGALRWISPMGGKAYDQTNSLCFDAQNQIWITGSYADTASFGNTTMICAGERNMFVARFSTNGEMQYLKSARSKGNYGYSSGWKIRSANCGDVYVLGEWNEMLLDTFYLPICGCSPYGYPQFLARLDSQGNAKYLNGSLREDMVYGTTGLAIDGNGNAYTAGWTHWSSSTYDIKKFDITGTQAWSQALHGGYSSFLESGELAINGSKILSVAYMENTRQTGNNWSTKKGLLFFSVDTAGTVLFTDTIESTGNIQPRSSLFNKNAGYFILNGYLLSSITMGNQTVDQSNGKVFVAKSIGNSMFIGNSKQPEIRVFPNPNCGTFFIDGEIDRLNVLNITGGGVPFSRKGNELSIESPGGIYFVQIFTQKGIQTIKVEVQR